MKRLDGKRALITGGARGIGLAFAQAYVREGASVVLADIDFARAEQSANFFCEGFTEFINQGFFIQCYNGNFGSG